MVFVVFIFAGCATSSKEQPSLGQGDKVAIEKGTISTEDVAKLIGNNKLTISQKIENSQILKEKYKNMMGRGYVLSIAGIGDYHSALLCTDTKEECATFTSKDIQIKVNLDNIPKAIALSWNKGDLIEFLGKITNVTKMGSRQIDIQYLNAKKIE